MILPLWNLTFGRNLNVHTVPSALGDQLRAIDLKPSAADLDQLETAAPPGAAAGLAFPSGQKRVGEPEESA